MKVLALFGTAVLLLGACSTATPSPSPTWPPVRISNQTSVAMTVVVNGSRVAVVPAGGVLDPVPGSFPARPWVIQIESPLGRPLLVSDFPAGDFTVGHDVVAGNLACGVIYLNIADQLPGGGPAFIPIPGASPCD